MSTAPPDSARSTRLSKYFGLVLQGKRGIRILADAKLFLEAICDQEDHQSCVEKLVASPPALSGLQSGLRFDVSPSFIKQYTAPFITYLSEPAVKQVCNGQFLRQLLLIIVDPPTLWIALLTSYKRGLLAQDSVLAFAWLLLELLSLPGSSEVDVLEDAQGVATDGFLLNSPSHEIRTLGHKIKHILLTKTSATPIDPECAPGGRHDNDFADFRKVAIYPTADEFLSTEKPFYRRADAITEAQPKHRVAMHLDNQFRLLREDMLAELRDDLQSATKQKKGRRSALILRELSAVGVFCGDESRWKPCSLAVQCNSGLEQLTALQPAQRKEFLRENRRFLKHQSFGCMVCGGEIVAFATVDRNEDALIQESPIVMLQISGDEALKKALLALKQPRNLEFWLVDTPIFAYEPILRCLQEKIELPLAEELLAQRPQNSTTQPTLIPDSILTQLKEGSGINIQHILRTAKAIKLDTSQMASLIAGLTQLLSLIQGPPGTGKSFIGALLAKAFHAHTSETILVICYTNHALDQFLEDFLDIGIPPEDIVRLGSKSTPRTACLNMSEQQSSYKRSQSVWKVINDLKSEADELQSCLTDKYRSYNGFSIGWKDILEYLEFSEEDAHFYEALCTPAQKDGMTMVDQRGRNVGPNYLFNRWSKGNNAGIFIKGIPREHQDVWDMDFDARQACLDRWTRALLQEQVSQICGLVQRFNRCQARLDGVLSEKTMSLLKQKRVIGCTTTAAAKYARDLQSASPGVILVEEAGEILESHILTAMSSKTKRLALIGDHKQLRPKVNHYALTVEKGDGYDLNRSLFERLVLAGYPHTTLTNQHRMCPEISSFVRHLTYPDLLDDKKTLNRSQPRGLQDRVIFFNHNHPEIDTIQIADRRDEGAKASKRNMFEAEIVLKTVRYLAQQGYGTDKLVVLTPYLGQLHLLQNQLSKENDPILNDLDSFDLVRAGLLSRASAGLTKRPIRISTIDNYQGEESDIVIASLTRSNKTAEIGFMAAPQRLNVLLSRARIAIILIGNADTFMKSRRGKEAWVPFLDRLSENRHLYDGLPVKCEQHSQKKALLQNREDFETECPDGGCAEPWPCFKNDITCRACESEDRTKELKRQRDHELEVQRESKQKEYACQLAEVQDEIAHQRRILRGLSEQDERERVLRQQQQDLNNLRDTVERAKNISIKDPTTSTVIQIGSTAKVPDTTQNSVSNTEQVVAKDQNQGDIEINSSTAKAEWEHQKEFQGAQNEALDSLMGMIGLEDVKDKFLSIKSKVDTAVRQNVNMKEERFGAALLGNPGTGKTTVARLYAKFLTSVGALPGCSFVETTGSRLANDGVSGAQKQIEGILNNGGGVFFIDEAYQLASAQSFGGSQVLDFLLAEVENLTGKVVFVLAGYNKQMEAFFSHNPGIPSRFPHELQFKDYDDDELLRILAHKINQKYGGGMNLESGAGGLYSRIVARRIGRGRGREGFGNARAVENVCANIAERQANRLRQERRAGKATNDMNFSKEDLIGPEPSLALQNCRAWRDLQNLIGLTAVKQSVQALFESILYNYSRELEEKPLVEYSLNRVFLGSPGTGKTSVAKLYGQVLADIGLLSNGEVVVKNPADFVGSVLGESEKNTKGILASTVGKVLVIDEAYGLYGGGKGDGGGSQADPYKTAVIDTIVAEVQSTPGEDRCVLLLGYKDQMEDMFQKVNPGLSRRFPLDSAFVFEDFTDDELSRILDLKLKQQCFETTDQGKKVALEVLRRARNRPHFGNAGEVDILLNAAKARHQRRLSKAKKSRNAATLEAQDFDEDFDRGERTETNIRMLFEGVVGCDNIVAQLEGYQEIARNMKKIDMDPREQIPFNFLFRGPPGTGKTTTARKMGKVYYDMGFLATAEVVESSATELVGQYVGQTGPKTQKLLEKALGKVLFIDEAYRLAEGHFAKEAMDEIVDSITKPKFSQKLIIILAGYDADINRLMSINPGLTSRFPEALLFRGLNADECVRLATELLQGQKQKLLQRKGDLDITVLESPRPGYLQELLNRFKTLSDLPNWANARDIQTLVKGVFGKAIKSATESPGRFRVEEETILAGIDAMIAERAHRSHIPVSGQHPLPSANAQPIVERFDSPSAAPITRSTQSISSQKDRPPSATPNHDTQATPDDPPRDTGVSDEVWQRLQQDKAVTQAREQEYERLLKQEAELQESAAAAERERQAAAAAAAKETAQHKANDEAKRRHEEERLRYELERRAHEAELEALQRKRQAEEEQRRKEREAQSKLRQMGVCCAGYRWIKQAGGYRCAGGYHFVSDAALGMA
ncbi:MAG: hypothetical protein Q9217_005011 [Psora testacea]